MMKQIPIDDEEVIGLSFAGTITSEDIDRSYELVEAALDREDEISLYMEMLDGFDVEAPAMLKDVQRAPELFGKLDHFERVAVVTNEDWLRGIVRLEEAMLSLFESDIELHVYDESERDQAMKWVRGATPYSHEPAITELPSDDPNIAAFEVNGKIRAEDIELSKKIMTQFLTDDPPRRVLAKVTNLQGLQPSILFDGQMIEMKREARRHLDRYAVVGGPEWFQHLVRSMGSMFDFQIKTFQLDEEEKAWEWLKETVPA